MSTDTSMIVEAAAVALPPPPAQTPVWHRYPIDWTLAELQKHLGGIPPERIRMHPAPGTATKEDVEAVHARTKRTCELIDGVLVEKTVGYKESLLAAAIIESLRRFLRQRHLGKVLAPDGALEILVDQVRAADACYISREKFPGGALPDEPIPRLVPDLAVEVLSKRNTKAEMQRKVHDYFAAGVRLVWYIDPRTRTATVYTAEHQFVEVDEQGILSGGDVLPGFTLSLRELFAELEL